jgi:hypothetical protein
MNKYMFGMGLLVSLLMTACQIDDVCVDIFFENGICDIDIDADTDTDTDTSPSNVDGIDILVVVDNSGSMTEEQRVLSTGFFTLINSLVNPLDGVPVESVRVGVTTTDMGLQYSWDRIADQDAVTSCEAPRGDDGRLMPIPNDVTVIDVESGVIACEPGGGQCPAEFKCVDGLCIAPGGISTVNCPAVPNHNYVETTPDKPNPMLATQVACLSQQGTDGCGVEQQLSAATRAVERNAGFLVETHTLQVIVVTDEEDCSVEDPGLFQTPEWLSGPGKYLNVACNYPDEHNSFLFSPAELKKALVEAKQGRSDAVSFAAIVGVPQDGPCQGNGDSLEGCLEHPDMVLEPEVFTTPTGNEYIHFTPACSRVDSSTGVEVTMARPGRRFVQIAEAFGSQGYVYSICNADWSPAMERIGGSLVAKVAKVI